MTNNQLTQQEKLFCELYITGEAPFAGNPAKCYKETFGYTKQAKHKALELLAQPHIQEYVEELETLNLEEAKHIKQFLTQNLMKIVSECTTAQYTDRKNTVLSPAPLRSVAVNAAKTLMDMFPVKQAQVNKLSIDGGGENGITFNVIVPEQKKNEDKTP